MGNDCGKMCFGAEDNSQQGQKYIALATKTKGDSPDIAALFEKDKQYFMQEEKWFEKQGKLLIDPEKLIEAFPNYVKEQVGKTWKGIDLEPKIGAGVDRVKTEAIKLEWKYILRKGAQMKDIRDIILNIFNRKYENNNLEYETQLKTAFDHVPETFKNVPLFTHEESLEDVLKVHFLNEDGLTALKRILWMFRKSFPNLEYCPMLAPVISLLLIFLSESEAYCVTRFMLEVSTKLLDERGQHLAEDMRAMRWHFTLGKEDFEKFISSFFENIKAHSKGFSKLLRHFEKIGFDYNALFQELFRHLFLGYVPFSLALQMFLAFLNEGVKIYYRMGYALFSFLRDKLLPINNPGELKKALLQFASKLDDKSRSKIIKKAYALHLIKMNTEFSKLDVNPGSIHEAKVYYRPLVSQASSIIKEEIFEVLWQWLPKTSKLCDPLLLFTTYRDGFSLKSMYKKCEEYSSHSMIILIKSDQNTIFGAYIDDLFRVSPETENKYSGTNNCFVFMLYPKEVAFFSTEKNQDHLLCTHKYFSIGSGGEGNAIYLDHDLLNGSSSRSETYDNIQLNGKTNKLEANFKCAVVSVLSMDIIEEHFTIYIHSNAENMTTHLNKDVWRENDYLFLKNSTDFGDVSVYNAYNIHAIDKGTHKISIGARSNGLIEALLCMKQGAAPLSTLQKELGLFGKLYDRIESLIKKFRGFELFTNNMTHKCEGIILSPERILELRIDMLVSSILSAFFPRIPNANSEKIWNNRFNLEIVASKDKLECMSLYLILLSNEGLKFGLQNLTELFFSFRSRQEVFEVYANLSASENIFIDRGSYLYSPLTYYTEEQTFNGTGLHPKLTRRFALQIYKNEVYSMLKYDQSCVILIQESIDRGNYIDIDEVNNDKNMTFHTFGIIDIERPSSHSSQHTYFIQFFLNTSSYLSHDDSKEILWINFTTPYHFRYQPAGDSEYTLVSVWETSQMYLSCQGYQNFKMDEYNRMESGYLDFLEEKFNRRFIVVPSSRNDNMIIAKHNVPTGLMSHRPMATYISLGTTAISCFILIVYILRRPNVVLAKFKPE